jgi:uridine kinase
VLANTGERMKVEPGTPLSAVAEAYTKEVIAKEGKMQWPVLGGLVNNQVETLQYRIYAPKTVKLLTIRSQQGFRMYRNALCFMLYTAVHDCYPKAVLSIDHSMQNGFYCRIESAVEDFELPDRLEVCRTVREHMIELQEQDIPFTTETLRMDDAIELVRPRHMPKTLYILEHLRQLYIEMNFLGKTAHKINGKLAPSTGCISTWDLRTYEDGYLLLCADPEHPDKISMFQETPKLFAIFREHHQWVDLMHTSTVGDYNRIVQEGGGQQLILLAEALHEKKYGEIADQVRHSGARMVLLAGPSSSGKTTSCRRLSVQLRVLGYDVQQLSLDDYFMERARTPKLPTGEYDFESVDALDIPLLNEQLNNLFKGEEVKVPTFDFLKGEPFYSGKTLKLGPRSVLVVEGIHALNPELTAEIPDSQKFRIYASALTTILLDNHNYIPTTDNRLLRRIIRDYKYRGVSAQETIRRWPSVRKGENRWIFPYQENADAMFNSAMLFELAVIKQQAEPLLEQVPENCPEYAEAYRLLKFLRYIKPIPETQIPPTSLLREFLGGSSFHY